MKPEAQLIKELLIYLQDHEDVRGLLSSNIAIDGYDANQICYHLELMQDEKLVEGIVRRTFSSSNYQISRLTSAGHRLAETVKKPVNWKEIKEHIAKEGFDFTFAALRAVAFKYFGL